MTSRHQYNSHPESLPYPIRLDLYSLGPEPLQDWSPTIQIASIVKPGRVAMIPNPPCLEEKCTCRAHEKEQSHSPEKRTSLSRQRGSSSPRRSYPPSHSIPLEQESRALRTIIHASKDVTAIATAVGCVFPIHHYRSLSPRQQGRITRLFRKGLDSACAEHSSALQGHIDAIGRKCDQILALAVQKIQRSGISITTASRIPPLNIRPTLANPPPLLFLSTSILFSFALAYLLHSQATNPYRNHILFIGLLAGTLVGALEAGESFLLDAKGYLVGSTILALLLSLVVHAALRFWQGPKTGTDRCVCGDGKSGWRQCGEEGC